VLPTILALPIAYFAWMVALSIRSTAGIGFIVLPALERPQVSAPLLDTFVRSPDLGLAAHCR
jgi:hypothetical protein